MSTQQNVEPLEANHDTDEGLLDSLAGEIAAELGSEPVHGEAEPEAEEVAEATEGEEEQAAPVDQPKKIKVGDQEFDESELKDGILRQQDYTRKTQELAERRKALEPWEWLIKTAQTDQGFVEHIRAYQGQQQAQQQARETPPEDPYDRMKWEAKQEVLAEIKPMLGQQEQRSLALQHQQRVEATKMAVQRDEMFSKVMEGLKEYIQAMPPRTAQEMYQKLDRDPDAFIEHYQWMRERVAKPAKPVAAPAATEVKRETKAPRLESAGKTVPTQEEAAVKAKRVKDMRTKLRRGELHGADKIVDYLEASGALAGLNLDD